MWSPPARRSGVVTQRRPRASVCEPVVSAAQAAEVAAGRSGPGRRACGHARGPGRRPGRRGWPQPGAPAGRGRACCTNRSLPRACAGTGRTAGGRPQSVAPRRTAVSSVAAGDGGEQPPVTRSVIERVSVPSRRCVQAIAGQQRVEAFEELPGRGRAVTGVAVDQHRVGAHRPVRRRRRGSQRCPARPPPSHVRAHRRPRASTGGGAIRIVAGTATSAAAGSRPLDRAASLQRPGLPRATSARRRRRLRPAASWPAPHPCRPPRPRRGDIGVACRRPCVGGRRRAGSAREAVPGGTSARQPGDRQLGRLRQHHGLDRGEHVVGAIPGPASPARRRSPGPGASPASRRRSAAHVRGTRPQQRRRLLPQPGGRACGSSSAAQGQLVGEELRGVLVQLPGGPRLRRRPPTCPRVRVIAGRPVLGQPDQQLGLERRQRGLGPLDAAAGAPPSARGGSATPPASPRSPPSSADGRDSTPAGGPHRRPADMGGLQLGGRSRRHANAVRPGPAPARSAGRSDPIRRLRRPQRARAGNHRPARVLLVLAG